VLFFFFSSRRRHTRWPRDWSSDVCSSDLLASEIWNVIEGDDWVLTGADLEEWALRLWDIDSPKRYPGHSLGTATQISTSLGVGRSEERRVGKECRCGWGGYGKREKRVREE